MPFPVLTVDQLGTNNINYAPADITNPLPFNRSSEYPLASTPVTNSSGNVAAAAATATLAGAAGKTTFITGFEITSTGATAPSVVVATVTGTAGGVMSYVYAVATGAMVGNPSLTVQFPKPVPASAVNTAIVVSLPSLGAGNTNAAVVAHGYQQ